MIRSTHLPLTVVGLLLTGCDVKVVNGSSNFPDSGLACNVLRVDAGGVNQSVPSGSGTLTGSRRFTVKSSYQARKTLIHQSTDAGRDELSFALYGGALSCVDVRGLDGGGEAASATMPILAGVLQDPDRNQFPVGSYFVGSADGGPRAFLYLLTEPADGGRELLEGLSGVVNLDSLQPCALSGTLDATFGSDDGGATSLSGSFSSAFCN